MSADLTLFAPVLDAPAYRALEARVREGARGHTLSGLVPGARALVLTLLAARTGMRFLLVVPDDTALDVHQRDLAGLAVLAGRDPKRVVVFPALDADPHAGIAPHPEVTRDRVVALGRLARADVDILVVPIRALLQKLPAAEELRARVRTLLPGGSLPPDRFLLEALASGYRRVDVVAAQGEVSRRGGILDVFPPEHDEPVRIELFGDTIESLRAFDTDHQRSTRTLERAVVGPAVENPPSEDALSRLRAWLEAGAEEARRTDGPVRPFRERLETLQNQGFLPGLEALAGVTAARPTLLLEHARDLVLVVDEPEQADDELIRAWHDIQSSWEASGERVLPPPERLFAEPASLRRELSAPALTLRALEDPDAPAPGGRTTLPSRPARHYAGRVGELAAELARARERGTRVVCVLRARGMAERLGEVLAPYGLPVALSTSPGVVPGDVWSAGGLFVLVGSLRDGFEFPEYGFVALTERETFGEEVKAPSRKDRSRAAFLSDFRDLKVLDLVVHVDHGLARYTGLGRPKGGSLNRDFMVLEFAGGDRLFVPVDRLDLVQKYSGVAGHAPALDRLGGTGWEKVKAKVRKSVASMAKDLLDLYARRRAASGHAFAADGPWQAELEAAFPYETTPDQCRAIAEVKADMESDRPMDRLLVGDVGFGKTEVAVRAAFKAVMDGHQTAFLSPTTVLAAQHLTTLRERYAPFPVRVEMVSRFKSPADIRAVLQAVERGEVDILVGTHRLLSRDVRFRRLGLLVVDEEQRFGVAHKERLKQLAVGIDVLSMTATPIPRTLQMSLAGVRDLSVIETPPPGRMAIQTTILPFRKNVIAQAIRQELRRQGQVFFVHNRVETLPALARALVELIPEARVVVGHGQMGERQLERVMLRFVEGQADLLLTTTIIENGLDIPRANTIFVNRADRYGLAQLYQLRGRVGRSQQRAYAYFLVPGQHVLTEVARKRLKALQEFGELGAGFRLAAADLEIRGAGEFLGSRQHGHIAALGFDLYTQMLEQAVHEVRGEPAVERAAVALHLGVDIKVPESYMADTGDRLVLYKRLAGAHDEAEVDRLQADAEDRYGHLPVPGRNLFDMARLRLVAERAGVRSVDVVEARLQIRFHERPGVDPQRVLEMVARERGALTPSGMMLLPAPERAGDRIAVVRSLLERLSGKTAA